MKKLYTLLTAVVLTASVFAQAPDKMSYQAVVRDAGNALVTSTAVGMQLSILQGSVTGTAVYVETQTPATNINGLASIEIGSGTVVSGTFNTIDWSAGPYFIKTETDPTGGTTYTITGTSQLMSVPYALHSKTAESITGTVTYTETDPIFGASVASGITGTDTTYWNNKLTTEVDGSVTNEIQALSMSNDTLYLSNGGFVKLPTGFDGQYTSLTGAPTNVSTFTNDAAYLTSFTEVDGSVTNEIQTITRTGTTVTLTNGGGSFTDSVGVYTAGTGIDITNNVISTTGNSTLAIGDSYQGGKIFWLDASGQHGLIAATADQSTGIRWYNGLNTITNAVRDGIGAGKFNTERIIANQGPGAYAAQICANYQGGNYGDWYLPSEYELNLLYLQKTVVGGFASYYYWSSTEYDTNSAWYQSFSNGFQYTSFKDDTFYVRAVRAF